MKSKRLFPPRNKEHTQEKQKIEVIDCPNGGNNCKDQLAEINQNYSDSTIYKKEKEYLKAIHLLRDAWQKTHELKQSSCLKCAELFRETISGSMENIHNDLHNMTTGIFRNKRYQEVYLEASKTLKEFDRK